MRRGPRITAAILTVLAVGATGTGAALALADLGDRVEASSQAVSTGAGPVSGREAAKVLVEPRRTLEAVPEPEPLLERGDRGTKIRELQHRLLQLAWYTPPMSGSFDLETLRGVEGFQRKRGFEVTGEVDVRTWRRLGSMTRRPTGDEMFNRAGPALFEVGDSGAEVREIQARLRQIAWFFGDVSDYYGDQTVAAVKGFQAKRMIPITGEVDQRTLDLLAGMTYEPTADELANRPPDPPESGAPLDPRCMTGSALCIDKSSNSLRWVVDGDVELTFDVRFGREGLETREGQFAVSYKSRDHVSSLYDTSMPFAMFFSGGQAVHYSPDFAANGYNGASHGCVNVRDYDGIAALFDQVTVGTKVVVYWS